MSTSGGIATIPYPTPQRASGDYVEPWPGVSVASQTMVNGHGHLVPFLLTGPLAVSALGIAITVAGDTGCTSRLGVYHDSGHGTPSGVAIDAGTVAADAIAVVQAQLASTVTLAAGWYWTVATLQGAVTTAAGAYGYPSQQNRWPLPSALLPAGNIPTQANTTIGGWVGSFSDGPLPDVPAGQHTFDIVTRVFFTAA